METLANSSARESSKHSFAGAERPVIAPAPHGTQRSAFWLEPGFVLALVLALLWLPLFYRAFGRELGLPWLIFAVTLPSVVLAAGVRHMRRVSARTRMLRRRLRDALAAISQGVVVVDAQGRVVLMNRQAHDFLSVSAEHQRVGTPFSDIIRDLAMQGGFGTGQTPEDLTKLADNSGPDANDVIYERTCPDGRVIEVRTHGLDSGGAVRLITDITDRIRSEARVRYLAHHDALTGLANRVVLRERLTSAIAGVGAGRPAAVLLIDLDRFKAVNDRLGHDGGDALLIEVARRLNATIRGTDTVARLGGDEFAVIVPQCAGPEPLTVLATRIIDTLSLPVLLPTGQAMVGASVGVALARDRTITVDTLLTRADIALYRAKNDGRGRARFYEPLLEAQLSDQRALESELQAAIGTPQLSLHYQPLCDAVSGDVLGFEALLRWRHPTCGLLSPAAFIPLAEKTGLIISLGAWVLRQACGDAVNWDGAQRVCVNVSPAQLRVPGFLSLLDEVLKETGLPPARLELEVTETLLPDDLTIAAEHFCAMRAMGISIALDDFGTGYATIEYLKRLPVDRVKIDGTFIQALLSSNGSRVIVDAILSMCRSLGLRTTAEGVETRGQAEALASARCDELQGFYLARPMPAADVPSFLNERAGKAANALDPS